MAKKSATRKQKPAQLHDQKARNGKGGELHQVAGDDVPGLTTQQGTPVADDQNSLRIGARGPDRARGFSFSGEDLSLRS